MFVTTKNDIVRVDEILHVSFNENINEIYIVYLNNTDVTMRYEFEEEFNNDLHNLLSAVKEYNENQKVFNTEK